MHPSNGAAGPPGTPIQGRRRASEFVLPALRYDSGLRGVDRRGRLGVLYSNKDYGCEWDYDWRNKRFQRQDNTKLAVNIVVYAMT